jgi:hypothetical protein
MDKKSVYWLILIPLSVIGLIFILENRLYVPLPHERERLLRSSTQGSEVALPLILIPSQSAEDPSPPRPIIGIGVLGDSNSDEYRAEDQRGGRTYGPVTLNWIEQLVLNRNLNFGEWGSWGEPRRSGYKYNWARSSANTRRMARGGQAAGLAEQVANGEVSHVIIWIGGNDFHLSSGTYEEIYDGSLNDAELQAKIDSIIEDLTLAVDIVLDAGEVQMVIINFLDKSLSVEAIQRFPNEAGRRRVSEAIRQVNERLAVMADDRGVIVVDFNAFAASLEPNMENGYLNVGGEWINTIERGNAPIHLQLNDRPGHIGTVFNGLIANAFLVEPFNQAFGLNIEPLSEYEILQNAGLR